MITIIFALFLCFIVGALFYWYVKKHNKLSHHNIPPGPRAFPLVGNMLQLDKKVPMITFSKWSEQYGDIYSFRMGANLAYMIGDPKMVRELFSQDPAFTGRMPVGDALDIFETGKMHGIIHTEGKHWEQLRRFTLRHLRDFGFGKSTMEALIMQELQEVMDWMKAREGEPLGNIKDKLTLAVVNSLWTILSGHRYSHDDPLVLGLNKLVTKTIEDMASTGGLILFAPWLKHVVPEWSGYNAMRRVMNKFRVIFSDAVQEHKLSYSDDYQRDFIDVFLKEIKECKDPDSAFFGEVGERQLVAVMNDLFAAGSDTTSITLDWTFLYLSTFPEVQEKLKQEIREVVGNSRHCSLSDRPNLPYTEALIAEIMRYSTIAPTGAGHKALEDRQFRGYFIPKGTTLLANFYYMHRLSKSWGDPDSFRPSRFLTPDGKSFQKHESFMPFSVGRRQCAGETLARDTLFLYVTNIFQRFKIQFDPNDPEANPGLEPKSGFMLNPKPYKVLIKDRQG